jgi:PAS domain S-box-containing protein
MTDLSATPGLLGPPREGDAMEVSLIAAGASKSGVRLGSWHNVLLVLCAICAFIPPASAQGTQKNILVLSGGRGRVSINQMESSLRAHFSGPVNFSVVDLDNPRFDQKSYQDSLAEALRAGYASEKLDLVVAVMTVPLRFAVQYRDKVFPGVPIVFMSTDSPLPEKMWPGVTGVHSATGVQETIDLALRLHPDAQAVAVISKGSDPNNHWFQAEHSELLRHRDKVTEIDLLGSASPELLQRVAELPSHTVVLFQLYPEDANQPAFGAMDVLADVAERFPTYSILPHVTVGHGGVGGASYDSTADPVLAGQLAARVLSGEKVDNIPVIENSKVLISVDWRQLRRWNIEESALPPGTRVLFREPTLWEQGRKYFLAALAVIVLQSLLIFALFWQRARRRKAEIELGKSEQKFSKAFQRSPLAITIVSARDGRYIDINEAFEIQTGWQRDEVIGRSPEELNLWVNPEQRIAFTKQLVDQANVKDLEVSFRRKDGQVRTGLGSAELIDVHGEPCALSVIADITGRKQAEDAMAGFSRRLIEAQETERTRIARELHDDINQRLAMVAISLKMAKEGLPNSEIKTSRILDETGEKVSELETDVQALSHRLHSSKLEYLGLEAAISGFCRELSERQNIRIDLHCEDIPEELSSDVSLCLFRVLQEALHNAAKYSGVTEFKVALNGAPHEIQMRVHDLGVGFDARRASNGHGLGLTSMKERLRLVNGELSINSEPGHGTTVLARVPLVHDATVASAAD